MSAARLGLVAAVVAAALAVPATAWAAWSASHSGSAYATAGSLTAPTVSLGTATCTGHGTNATATVPVSWNAIPGAGTYELQWDTATPQTWPANRTVTGITGTSGTAGPAGAKNPVTVYVRVRATSNNWHGAYSATVSQSIAGC